MIPPEGQKIIQLSAQGEYFRALGVSSRASIVEIDRAHLKLCSRFREFPEVIEALNDAKNNIPMGDGGVSVFPFRQRLNIFSDKLLSVAADICLNGFVRFLAVIGAVGVFYTLHNILLRLFVLILALFFVRSLRKDKTDMSTGILLGGGTVASVSLILWRFTPLSVWLRTILGTIITLILLVYPLEPLMKKIYGRLRRPTIWKSIGVFCVLFMLVFGNIYQFFPWQKATKDKVADQKVIQPIQPTSRLPSSESMVLETKRELYKRTAGTAGLLLEILNLLLFIILIVFVLGFCFGTGYLERLNNFSEPRFYFAVFLAIFITRFINEALFYIPVVGKYIGGDFSIPRQISEPASRHFAGFIIFNGILYILCLPAYLFCIKVVKVLFRRSNLSINIRLVVFALFSVQLVTYLATRGISFIKWKAPVKVGYAGFFDSIMTRNHEVATEPVQDFPQETAQETTSASTEPSGSAQSTYTVKEVTDSSKPSSPAETTAAATKSEDSGEAVYTKDFKPLLITHKTENEFTGNLSVIGILLSGEDSHAILDDKESKKIFVVKKGKYLDVASGEKIKIEQIRDREVILDYEGKKITLSLNSETNKTDKDVETLWLFGEVVSVFTDKNEIWVKYNDFEDNIEKTVQLNVDNATTYENVTSLNEIKEKDEVSVDFIASTEKYLARKITKEIPVN